MHPGAELARPVRALDIATHEAGHAVIGMRQTPPLHIERVWIDLGGRDKLGFCACQPRVAPEIFKLSLHPFAVSTLRAAAFADVVDTLAGPVAEELCCRRSVRDVVEIGDRLRDEFDAFGSVIGNGTAPRGYVDLEKAERILLWTFDDEAGEMFTRAWNRAVHLVVKHRHAIRRLAHRLALKNSLDHDEIVEVLRRKRPRSPRRALVAPVNGAPQQYRSELRALKESLPLLAAAMQSCR